MLMDSKRILGTTPLLTKADCLSEKSDDFKNQLLIIRSSLLTPKFRYAEFQYFYAIGVSGDRVTGFYLADGAPSEIDRLGFHGNADPKKLPKWAAERLAGMQAPKLAIRIFQVDHDKAAVWTRCLHAATVRTDRRVIAASRCPLAMWSRSVTARKKDTISVTEQAFQKSILTSHRPIMTGC